MRYKQFIIFMILIVLSFQFSSITPAADTKIPFSEYADSFAKASGHQDVKRDEKALALVLDDSHVAVKIGLFDVWHPRLMLRDGDTAKQFKIAAGTLVDLQERWIDWTTDDVVREQCSEDIKILKKWINSWSLKKISRRKDGDNRRPDLLDLLKAKETVSAASSRFENIMIKPENTESDEEVVRAVSLILTPTRKNFLEVASFVGSLSEENKKLLWRDSVAMWTTFNCENIHVIAMEYPANYPGSGDITLGVEMNVNEKTGLLQHVAQNATDLLITHYHRNILPAEIINGFAMNMVLEMYKENNVRSGVNTDGKTLPAFSKFVPAGRSMGGWHPKRRSRGDESRWRKDKGKDLFLTELRKAQKDGAKKAARDKKKNSSKAAFFALQSVEGAKDQTVQAPFFMVTGGGKTLPDGYVNDFKEFFRAYRCAFVFWLMNKAMETEETPSSSDLLRRLLRRPDGEGSESIVKDVYGIPLTGDDETVDSLEWRFLDWLARGR